MNKTQLRELAIRLLDDENGINASAYEYLSGLLTESDNKDILSLVDGCNDRFFLPEEHGLKPYITDK